MGVNQIWGTENAQKTGRALYKILVLIFAKHQSLARDQFSREAVKTENYRNRV